MPQTLADAEIAELSVALERLTSWLRRAVRPTEWSAVALSTLDALDRHGPQRVTDLVARERITQPGMTGLVARFEAAGLATRGSDPTDGRATLVEISAAGRDYLTELRRQRSAVVAEHLREIPVDARRRLAAATDAIVALASRPTHSERP